MAVDKQQRLLRAPYDRRDHVTGAASASFPEIFHRRLCGLAPVFELCFKYFIFLEYLRRGEQGQNKESGTSFPKEVPLWTLSSCTMFRTYSASETPPHETLDRAIEAPKKRVFNIPVSCLSWAN
jgi:hypothetical protein